MSMTLTELGEVLAPLDGLGEVVVPRRGGHAELVSAEGQNIGFRIGGQEYAVSDSALEEVFNHVPGMSKAALTQWPEELLVPAVNWFLGNQSGDVRALTYNDAVISFPKREVPIHYPSQVLDRMVGSLGDAGVNVDELEAHKVSTSVHQTRFALVSPERSAEPKVNDVLAGGVLVDLSPSGANNIEMSPYVNRLVCTNGMISPVSLGRWAWRGDSGDGSFLNWVADFTTEAWGALEAEFEALDALTAMPINGHTEDVLRDMFRRHRVPARVRELVTAAALDEADGTMYGIAQSFNRAANEVEDLRHARDLWMVTGEMAHQTDRCESCFQSLH